MGIIIILLRIIEVLVCVMLVGVILLQRNKGQGAGVSFGGGASEAVFGAHAGDVLTKATVILGITFLVNTLILSILIARDRQGDDHWLRQAAPMAPVEAAVPVEGGEFDLSGGAIEGLDAPVAVDDALDAPAVGEIEAVVDTVAETAPPTAETATAAEAE